MPETDRYGSVLVKASTEEIITDLAKLSQEDLLAVAASMARTLFEFNWKEQFVKFCEGVKGNG